MKVLLPLIVACLFLSTANSQSRRISKARYERVIKLAISKTNDAYPVVFKVTTNFIENGKIIRTVIDFNENESGARNRLKRTTISEGRRTNQYQVSPGADMNFCSDDGVSWKTTKNQCFGPVSIYGPREVETSEYSVRTKWVKRKRVNVYLEYSVFAPYEGEQKREFQERVSTIDSRGFFTTVVDTEGTLTPKKVTLRRKQYWVTNARIKPVVPPIGN